MILENYLQELNEKPSKEMIDFYEIRTKNHIKRVQDNIKNFIKSNKEFNSIELAKRIEDHDKSKFSEIEYIPYIWLTEYYR